MGVWWSSLAGCIVLRRSQVEGRTLLPHRNWFVLHVLCLARRPRHLSWLCGMDVDCDRHGSFGPGSEHFRGLCQAGFHKMVDDPDVGPY